MAGDQARLASLALSEREFRDHIWPDLPAARPERNLPFSYVWGDLQQKSDAGRRAVVAQYRGRAMALVDVRFGEVATYGRYAVHRDAVFAVRNGEGITEEVRVCGSMVQAGRTVEGLQLHRRRLTARDICNENATKPWHTPRAPARNRPGVRSCPWPPSA